MAWLQPMATIPIKKKINIAIYFENLTVKLFVLYMFLIYMSNFMSIRCYLLFDP